MKEEILDVLNRLLGKKKENEDIAEYFITIFKKDSVRKVKEIIGETDYSVYDHPYFNAEANTIRDDVLELTEAVLESL